MTASDFTHDPAAKCWVDGADGHAEFPVQNLPLCIFSTDDLPPRAGFAIGDHVLDLTRIDDDMGGEDALNRLFRSGTEKATKLRQTVFSKLTEADARDSLESALFVQSACTFHMPFQVGDYTDFYTGIEHATNIGKLFRPDNPLLPNYKHVPIGYHGRASSVCVSGTDVHRPSGQTKAPDADAPSFGPCKRLDYEMEMGIWVAGHNALSQIVNIADAPSRIAGLCILNDWSARDIQAWEYQPLGPFLAKSFASTVSPFVVTADALAPFRVAQRPRPDGDPAPMPHLWDEADQAGGALGVTMEVHLSTAKMRAEGTAPHRLSRGTMEEAMYWTAAQLITHHASNGCDLNTGDLYGTGTLSGADTNSLGSLIEITGGGKQTIELPSGETRTFLENGDEIVMTAYAEREGFARIGFGECRAVIAD